MKIFPYFLAALAPFVAVTYNGYLGHALVVVLTVGIFLGTLSLQPNGSLPPSAVPPKP